MIKTRQEMFDIAYRGLAAQRFRKSQTKNKDFYGCRYRSPRGLKCAIGHCIPDEKYTGNMEGVRAASLPFLYELFDVREIGMGFLMSLQGCHDGALSAKDMRRRMEQFAFEGCLAVPEVAK